ncbi:hypothetical protein Cgig2_018396 [Carnegiea gigantea]|uniref:F-box domain-containing protein n=1 Tax=Carnegiea gigantea TaxID=171969 RepID=A0A9Q1JLZ8_9CARY|nr:hypothetical protein Cgig2_018396 [Carnegiea gigantea]
MWRRKLIHCPEVHPTVYAPPTIWLGCANLALMKRAGDSSWSECNVMQEMPIDSDTLIEVLARLPAKSVLKFKCVSKHWFSLLTHPFSMNLYQSRSSARTIVPITLSPGHTIYRILNPNPSPSHRFFMIDGENKNSTLGPNVVSRFWLTPSTK